LFKSSNGVQLPRTRCHQHPPFLFLFLLQATEKNWENLKSFDLNLHRALQAQDDSSLKLGSESKDPKLLYLILGDHPLWSCTFEKLTNGATYPLTDIQEEHHFADIQFFLSQGNHKSVLNNKDKVKELLLDDVTRGCSLILPKGWTCHQKLK
jgi:hypothetical protein